jgi:hypothetical protein
MRDAVSGDTAIRAPLLALLASVALGGCSVAHQMSNVQPVSLTTGIVSGHVLNAQSGQPVFDATLLLLDEHGDSLRDDQQHESRSYSPDGAYRFISVRPGSYRLRTRAAGFSPDTSDVFGVTVNGITTVDMRLRPLPAPN